MAILVHDPPSYALKPPTSDNPDHFVFELLVKNYYHAKFWASNSKIDQVMAILVLDPPLTPLTLPLTPLTSLYIVKNYYHAKFWVSSSKIGQVMAILLKEPLLHP